MRSILIIFLFLSQTVFCQSVMQKKLNFSVVNTSINGALQKLSDQTGVDIAFSRNFFKNNDPVTVELKNETFETVLSELLKQTTIGYKQLGGRIILFKKKISHQTLSGFITDTKTGERLLYATIYCPQLKLGAVTNEYGFYSITLPEGETSVEFSFIGYEKRTENIKLCKSVHLNISLNSKLTLSEVVVSPDNSNSPLFVTNLNNATLINKKIVKASPALAGEEDYLRVAQLLPGVQSGIDGLGSIQVRGGDGSQNLMMLDGVQIYIPYHLLGVFSLYNPEIIHSAKLLKSEIPARYGGRVSSVIDVRTRDGNLFKWETHASVNLLNANIAIEGPLLKEKSSILISGRYSPPNGLLEPVFKRTYFQDEDCELHTSFYDVNAKINYIFSSKDRLYGSFFTGRDSFLKYYSQESADASEDPDTELGWSNSIFSLRWNHLFNDKLFVNTTFTTSLYGYNFSSLDLLYNDENTEVDSFTFILKSANNREIGLKTDFDYIPNANHTLRFGAGYTMQQYQVTDAYLDINSEEVSSIDTIDLESLKDVSDDINYNAMEGFAYIEDQVKLGDKTTINIGLRLSFYAHEETRFFNPEPRLSLNHKLSKKISLHSSLNRMVQYTHLLSNKAVRLPSDFWIPSSDENLPQKSWHTEIGVSFSPDKRINFSTDIYYRLFQNLYSFKNESMESVFGDVELEDDYSDELKGKGYAYGMEFLLQYSGNKTGGSIAYALSKTERKIQQINSGKVFPFMFDRRHHLKLFLYQNLGHNFQLSANWVYYSPGPKLYLISFDGDEPLSKVNITSNATENSIRTYSYHRLDVGLSYTLKTSKVEHRFKLGAYNVYNRENIAYYKIDFNEEDNLISDPVYSIGFIPSVYYSISF